MNMIGKQYFAPALIAMALAATGCNDKAEESTAKGEADLQSMEQKVSYIFGRNIAENFEQQEIRLDSQALALALEDVYNDKPSRISDEEVQSTMDTFQQEQMAKQQAAMEKAEAESRAAGEENKKAGEEFLAANAEKEGVVTLASGLQYKIIEEGTGPKPTAQDTVTVHYRGTLIDGTQFDSSYDRGEPVSFPLDGVIPGWTEGLQQVKEGSKFELYIPSDLAYGPGGTSGAIGPNAALIFEIELLDVQSSEEAAEPEAEQNQ